jgi:hypothetical protein
VEEPRITPASIGDQQSGRISGELLVVVGVVNVVTAGLGGLYLSTQSIVVTIVGAVLAAVLVLSVMLTGRRKP